MKHSLNLVAILMGLFAQVIFSQGISTNLPAGTSIHILDNGLQVLLIENPVLPMTGVNVVVKTGSAYETFATSGMSHMLEHLLFNGTMQRTQKQLYADVDRIGGYNNANTSYYYTNFMMVTPAEHIARGMEIQADMLFNSILPEDKFDKEKGIVLEEIAQSLDKPLRQIERNNQGVLYAGHAMSLPVLGTYATIEHMQRDEVYNYYKNGYVPNNMLMSVIGPFDTDSMLTLITDIYGQFPPAPVKRSGQVALGTGFTLPKPGSNSNVGVYHRFYQGDKNVITIAYDLPANLPVTYYDMLAEACKVHTEKIKTELIADFGEIVQSFETATIQNPVRSYLEFTITVTDVDYVAKIRDKADDYLTQNRFTLPQITVQLLATQAKTEFLKNLEKPHMFGIYNAELFAVNGIEAVLQTYSTDAFTAGAKWLSTLNVSTKPVVIVHHAAAKKIADQIQSQIRDTLIFDAKSGLTTIFRQNPKSELIAIHYMFKHKAHFEQKYGKDAAKILHECFGQRLKSIDNQKSAQQFGLTIIVNDNPYIPMDNIYLHPDFGYIRIEGLARNIPDLIQFLKLNLIDYIPSQEEFEKAQSNIARPTMMMAKGTSREIFTQKYSEYIYQDKKYVSEQRQFTPDNLGQFAREYFSPSNTIMSIVSPVSADSIERFITENLPDADANAPELEAYQRGFRLTDTQISEESQGKGEQSYVFGGYVTKVQTEDIPALLALSLVLKDSIIFDIREVQGRAYRMSAGLEFVQDKVMFYLRLGTRPDNVDPLLKQLPSFFESAMIENLSSEKLEKQINMYLGRMMFRRLSSINQAYYLAHSHYFFKDMYHDRDMLEQLKKVRVTDVKTIGQKYLNPKHLITIVVR